MNVIHSHSKKKLIAQVKDIIYMHDLLSRLAELPEDTGRKHHDGERDQLHRRLPAAPSGVHHGLLLALLVQGNY